MGWKYGDPDPCECCGELVPHGGLIVYGEADRHGHTWTHYACERCYGHCSSDDDGNPVHVAAEVPSGS